MNITNNKNIWIIASFHKFKVGDRVKYSGTVHSDPFFGIIDEILYSSPPAFPLYTVLKTKDDFTPLEYDHRCHEILGDSLIFVGTPVNKVWACECGNKHNPIGQGHSQWCPCFKAVN